MGSEIIKVSDPSQKYKFIFAAVLLVLMVLLLVAVEKQNKLGAGGNPISAPVIGSLGLNSSTTVGAVAVRFLAVNSGAQARYCTNTGGAALTWSATTTNLVANRQGALLAASSTLILEGDGLYQGDLYGITPVNGTSVIACMEI